MAEGSIIAGRKKTQSWRIGQKLGEGAFGQVHELVLEGTSNNDAANYQWVVKVCPLKASKGYTKKEIERASNMLNYERQMYLNNMPRLQGHELPRLPNKDSKNPEPIEYAEFPGTFHFTTNDADATIMLRGRAHSLSFPFSRIVCHFPE